MMSSAKYSKPKSIRCFLKKNLPCALGGIKFYDKLLDKIVDASIANAWTVFHQQFINDILNKGRRYKWTANPYLNNVDCPLSPGSVIVCREQSLREALTRNRYDGTVAGNMGDFCPPDLIPVALFPSDQVDRLPTNTIRRIYQSKNTEKAVIITLRIHEKRSIATFDQDRMFIDLDNLDGTGFDPEQCYVVSHVLYAERLTVEITFDGDMFYEHTYTGSPPICFRGLKVVLDEDGQGIVDRAKCVDHLVPVKLMKRRRYQGFFNVFIPNQARLSNSGGDTPPVLEWVEAPPIRTFRPRFLPRPDRPHWDIFEEMPNDLDLMHIINSGRHADEQEYGNEAHEEEPVEERQELEQEGSDQASGHERNHYQEQHDQDENNQE